MKRIILTLAMFASLTFAVDQMEPSVRPPAGLSAEEVPMLVCVGWDDNAYFDAVDWFSNWSQDKKNKDGSYARTTFLSATGLISDNFNVGGNPNSTKEALLASWKKLYDDGHEYGNHTHSHAHGSGKDKSWWGNEIDQCNQVLQDKLDIPQSEITGFRTPFLEYSTGTFESLKERGGEYDCSIEFGYDWVQFEAGQNGPDGWVPAVTYSSGKAFGGMTMYWPYTLHNSYAKGSTPYGGASVGSIPGFWEIPVHAYQSASTEWDESDPTTINRDWNTSGPVTTGFDFNMWKKFSKEEFLRHLKFSFHQRLAGNRAPFNLNLHTDNYSEWNTDANMQFPSTTFMERREAIEEFIDYVLQYDEVRVVPYNVTIDYMREPKKHADYVAPTRGPKGGVSNVVPTKLKGGQALSIAHNSNNEIQMSIPASGVYSVRLTSLSGRVISELHSGNLNAGEQLFSLNGVAATGMYLIHVQGVVNSTARIAIK